VTTVDADGRTVTGEGAVGRAVEKIGGLEEPAEVMTVGIGAIVDAPHPTVTVETTVTVRIPSGPMTIAVGSTPTVLDWGGVTTVDALGETMVETEGTATVEAEGVVEADGAAGVVKGLDGTNTVLDSGGETTVVGVEIGVDTTVDGLAGTKVREMWLNWRR